MYVGSTKIPLESRV